MSSSNDWVVLASILRPQGRRGEVLADLHTDFPERFADRRSLTLLTRHGQSRTVQLQEHWLPLGNNAGRVVLKFEGIDSISDAATIAGSDVVIPPDQRVQLEEGSYFVSDLIGCAIVDGGRELGTVEDVHFPTSPAGAQLANAAPILVVRRSNGDELLIPLARAFLQNADLSARRIEMLLPPGLVEING